VTPEPSTGTSPRGESFGASPLRLHIGLGKAERILTLEVSWPASRSHQGFLDPGVNQFVEIHEFDEEHRTQVIRQ
jgi:ASPIC and UnbV